jgi:diguanylate cyclase (GGDEF)-like protein
MWQSRVDRDGRGERNGSGVPGGRDDERELLRAAVDASPDPILFGDLVARFGGDEFVVLADGVQGPQGAVRVAERVRAQLESPAVVEGREVAVSASIGIALSRRGYKSPEEMLHDADRATYQAKAIGRARYAVFGED